MSVFGNPTPHFSSPISDSQSLKEAYDLMFTAWEKVNVNLQVDSTSNLENTITWRFYDKIIAEKSRQADSENRQYCFSFTAGTSVTDGKGKQLGITDIQIQFGYDERQRFTLEAKLLNKPGDNNTSAYTGVAGMGRFMIGKYGAGVSQGGMIGYVLDGNVERAKKNVAESVVERRQTLGMAATAVLEKSALRAAVFETVHQRKKKDTFTIYHIFLAVNE